MKTVKNWKVILALVLVAALASLGGIQVASANSRSADADIIFTKWVTVFYGHLPIIADMAGVVSGDAGPGLFAGEVLVRDDTGDITNIVADYHINVGGAREFTARLNVTQDDINGTAVIEGIVTDGWMEGSKVRGGYQVIYPSGITNALGGKAFQGTLKIQRVN